METGHGVQVVSVEDDHSYHLNEEELEKILMSESIKDLPVALVSVAGAYRGGKSFLINFLLRYLSSSTTARSDGSWLGEDSKDLTGFSWRGGSERNTTGILMWSQPYVITLPTGEKVAVLLMDTQGTFDSTSSVKDCSTIFALSSLLSSTQIYNIRGNITEEDLHNLQLFTDYGKLMKEETGKAFQVLEFLIRDWMNPWEYAYGQAGGDAYLANKFKTDSNQAPEVRELRQHILASFEKITCFLMPHPGLAVSNPNFKGKISDITQDFINELKELATSILSPDNLCVKRINGQPVKSRELLSYFKSYMTIFNSEEIPTPTSILQATSNAGLLTASNEVREQFEKNMQRACGSEAPSMPASEVIAIHQRELAAARATFKVKKLLGDKNNINQKLEELVQELTNKQKEFIEINRLKTLKAIENGNENYEKAIEAVTKGRPLCVHALDLKQVHNDAVVAALNAFNDNRNVGPDAQDSDRDKYLKDLAVKYEGLELSNDHNNKTMVVELKAAYFEYIMGQVKSVPNQCENSFRNKHLTALSKAHMEFEARRNKPNSHGTDVYKSDLDQAIELQYIQAKQINASANQDAFKSALEYFNTHSLQPKDLRYSCERPALLRTRHEDAVRNAFYYISPRQVCDVDKALLQRLMDDHYEQIKAINDSSNERAVARAYWAYQDKYDSLSDHWYWAFTSWSKAREYHRTALKIAKDTFFASRLGGRSDSYGQYDYYLNNLVQKCENYYNNS